MSVENSFRPKKKEICQLQHQLQLLAMRNNLRYGDMTAERREASKKFKLEAKHRTTLCSVGN